MSMPDVIHAEHAPFPSKLRSSEDDQDRSIFGPRREANPESHSSSSSSIQKLKETKSAGNIIKRQPSVKFSDTDVVLPAIEESEGDGEGRVGLSDSDRGGVGSNYKLEYGGRARKIFSGDLDSSDSSRYDANPSEADNGGEKRRGKEVFPRGAIPEGDEKHGILKLSPAKLVELTNAPDSVPMLVQNAPPIPTSPTARAKDMVSLNELLDGAGAGATNGATSGRDRSANYSEPLTNGDSQLRSPIALGSGKSTSLERPASLNRAISTPVLKRKISTGRPGPITPHGAYSKSIRPLPTPLEYKEKQESKPKPDEILASPMPQTLPLPPLSIPAYLQLELSSSKPSPLYIHRPSTSEFPYESSQVKLERLLNFLLLPPQLERVLWFGALACLDAWLYTFTILPLRFIKALYILIRSWGRNLVSEIRFVIGFIYFGVGRMWQRRRTLPDGPLSELPTPALESPDPDGKSVSRTPASSHFPFPPQADKKPSRPQVDTRIDPRKRPEIRHRRTKSAPSTLLPVDKADILKGLLILISCSMLMYLDASQMYHSIRGQAAIKLYVIYNVLEVFDRLLSALGQDVLECLFSKETLERKPNGRSKILRPFWLFMLALVYNIVHSTALFYQVITLNVAVNSYSNALLTLLMSNQFVEIKSTVFKKFEKENLFQMTCADIVERFQLWLMLIIIASRNLIETGGLSANSDSSSGSSFLPSSFTIFPDWTGQIMGPFFLVLGTEMLVDWLKHAYITKFNNTRPKVYGRFLDVLTKDYYANAFVDPNLTKRLGLPTIPLSCLFIRASVQTYHMFLATHLPLPLPSPSTSLTEPTTSPATTAALAHIDLLFRRALRLSPSTVSTSIPLTLISHPHLKLRLPSIDTLTTYLTTAFLFLLTFLVLLALKLVLGMLLLHFSRKRFKGMTERERLSATIEDARRVGGLGGVVEMGDERRKWIYEGDEDSLRRIREKEHMAREKSRREGEREGGKDKLMGVERYNMVAKRIW